MTGRGVSIFQKSDIISINFSHCGESNVAIKEQSSQKIIFKMSYQLDEIKKIRKHIGLTQKELAKKASVSQSLIAKIESGRLDPTYSNAMKIFQALSDLEKKQEVRAFQIMNDRIVSAKPDESIKNAIEKMKKYKISQLPVVDDHKAVGFVSESILLDAILNSKDSSVCEIMKEAPPVVSKESSVNVISSLLRHYPLVIVSENGKLVGLITKSDLITKIYSK